MEKIKLTELKKTNKSIQHKIENMLNNNKTFQKKTNNYFPNIIYSTNNEETHTSIIKLKKGMKSDILFDEVFHKIICIKGKIKILFLYYNEQKTITSLNTQLVVPNAKYIIEVIEDSEIISVCCDFNQKEKSKLFNHTTIYNKINQ